MKIDAVSRQDHENAMAALKLAEADLAELDGLIARDAFDAQNALFAEIADLKRRLDGRQTVVRAVTLLATLGKTEEQAYAQLRQMAMAWRILAGSP